ncbi:MAG: porin [Planctomycetota bacterium]
MSTRLLATVLLVLASTVDTTPSQGADDVSWTLDIDRLEPDVPISAYDVVLATHASPPNAYAPSESDRDSNALVARLDRLEARNAELADAQSKLTDRLKGYAKSGHEGSTMRISGRVHLDLWGFPGSSPGVNGFETGDVNLTPQDQISFRRIRIGAKGDLACNMLYKLELELAGGLESEIRDVFLGWRDLPFLQTLQIGNQKRPYGLDHLNSSRFNVFLERPYVIESFNQDARRIGIQSLGVSDDLGWNWQYGAFNQKLIQDEGAYISDHWQSQIAGRLARTFWYDAASNGRGYAHAAIAGTWADTDENALTANFAGSGTSEAQFRHRPEARSVNRWIDTGVIAGADDYTLLAFESVLNVGAFQFVAEHQNVFLDRADAESLYLHGGYAYISYFLTGEHIPWNRERGLIGRVVPFENFFLVNRKCCGVRSGMGAWQVALRWSYADFADRDIRGGDAEALTAAVNWYWTPYAKLQFNYLYGDIKDNDLNAPTGAPNFGDYHIVGTRFVIDY